MNLTTKVSIMHSLRPYLNLNNVAKLQTVNSNFRQIVPTTLSSKNKKIIRLKKQTAKLKGQVNKNNSLKKELLNRMKILYDKLGDLMDDFAEAIGVSEDVDEDPAIVHRYKDSLWSTYYRTVYDQVMFAVHIKVRLPYTYFFKYGIPEPEMQRLMIDGLTILNTESVNAVKTLSELSKNSRDSNNYMVLQMGLPGSIKSQKQKELNKVMHETIMVLKKTIADNKKDLRICKRLQSVLYKQKAINIRINKLLKQKPKHKRVTPQTRPKPRRPKTKKQQNENVYFNALNVSNFERNFKIPLNIHYPRGAVTKGYNLIDYQRKGKAKL
jgi:hypothetical protein